MADQPTKEDIENLTSSMASMAKAIEHNSKLLLKQKDIFSSSSGIQKDIEKQISAREKDQKGINNLVKEENALLKNTKTLAADVASNFVKMGTIFAAGGILAATGKLVRDAVNLDNVTAQLSARMGKAVSKGELKAAVNNLQASIGASYEDAVNLVTVLSESRYVDNIEEAAKGANLFNRATGVSAGTAADLVVQLNKGAGLTTKSINAMLTGMTKVQQNIGLSRSGMEAVSEYIKKGAVNMAAFGKSSVDIQKMANNTTALVAAMEKVGVSAGDAVEIVDRLTDPDRIEDNILLYSQLGVSMEDALSGNVDLSNMDGQLKEMAQRIVDMGPIAGSQFAKSMGMSYKQATQMAKMEGNEVAQVGEAAQTAEDGALDDLKKMEIATEGIGKKAENIFNQVEGKIRKLPMALIVAGGLALATLGKMIKKRYDEHVAEYGQPKQFSAITEAIGSSIGLGFQKGVDAGKEKTLTAVNAVKRSIDQTIDRIGFSGPEKKMDALIAKAKKQSFFDTFLNSSRQNRADYFKEMQQEMETKQQELMAKFNDLSVKKKISLNDLKDNNFNFNDQFSLDPEKQKALEEIAKQLQHVTKLGGMYGEKLKNVDGLNGKWLEKSDQVKAAQESVAKAISEQEKATANLKQESEKLDKIDAERRHQAELLQALKKNGVKEDSDAYKEAKNRLITLEGEVVVQKRVENSMKALADKAKEKVDEEKKNVDIQEKELKNLEKQRGVLHTFTKITHGIANNMITAAHQKFDASTFGKAFNEVKAANGSRGKAFAMGSLAVGKQAGAGTLKMLGGIMKTLGPMAIVMKIVGNVLEKLQEPMDNLIEGVMAFLDPVMKTLMGPLSDALDQIAKALLPPMLRVLAATLKVVGFILTPVKLILKALSHLPVVGKAFEGMNKAIEAITGDDTVNALFDAANNMENSSGKLADAAKKQEDVAEEQQEAARISATNGDLRLVTAAKTTANPQASSTTTTTKESEVDSQLKELENNKRKKKEDNYRAIVEEKFNLLASKFDQLINILSQSKGPEYAAASKPDIGLGDVLEKPM